jgi:hypothetical protein
MLAMMNLSVFSIALIALLIPAVLIMVLVGALSRKRGAARAGAAALAVVGIVLFLLVGMLGLALIGTRTVVHHNTASTSAVRQAQEQIVHAQATIDQTRRQIEAQAAEVQARIQNGTSPGDRVMYEDPTTHTAQMVDPVTVSDRIEGPINSPGLQVLPDDPNVQFVPPRAPTDTVNDGVTALTVVNEQPPMVRGTPEAVQSSTGLTVAGRPWTDAVEEHQDFEADVYPSLESAAEALGRRAGQRLMTFIGASHEPTHTVYVRRDGVSGHTENQSGDMIITRELMEAVAAGLRQKLEELAYVSVEQPPTPEDIAVNVAVPEVSFENHNRWRTHTESRSGSIALRVQAPDVPFSISTRFADTPWLTDRTGFVRQYANGDWLVSYSDGTHSTHEGAREDALYAATNVLLPLAQARISQLPASDQHRFAQQMAKDPGWLRDRVADELVSRNLVTDRFAQRFDRSYGTVWREAVLVNASPTRVEEIARSLVQGVDAQVTYQRNTWFSFFALAGLIVGTYLFLNMATKGYYAWMLRLAALGGVAAAGFIVMHLF